MSQSECFPVHRLVWELLSKQETKKYIDELLKQEDISCEWKLHDSCLVTVHSKQKGLSLRAATKIRESILNKAYRVARYPVISRVKGKSTFNLTEEEYSLLILKTVEEELQIAATADIMDKIDKQLSDMEKQQNSVQACSQSTRRKTMSAKLPGQVHPVTSKYVPLSKLEMSFVKKLKFLEEFFAKSKLNWAIDDKNCQVVIKATEVDDVVTSLKREIKNFCAGVSKSKQNVHVQGECWMLFQFKSMHNYIENRVQENGLLCVWEIQNDDICVYALNEGDAQKAARIIRTLMSQHSVAGMDLKHSDVQEILQKHKEKVILLGEDTDDPTLVLCVDVENEILAVIEKCQTTTAKMRSQEQLQSSEECIEFLLTKHKPFISTIQKDCRVTVQQSPDKSCLTITGEKESVTKAKAKMQTYIGNISERVLNLNYLPETLEDKTKKKKFEHMNNCQISVKEKDIVRPRPSYVWIEKSVHLMLVQGNIEDSDADVIVCPVDLEMNLMTSGEKIFRKGGDVLHENFKLHAADVVVKGDLYLSAVTGNLHSPYIMYSAFPSTSQRGSSMPTTKSVFNNKTEKIFKKADSEELNSLALPLNVSNVDVVADYFGESLGSTKCLKQIYLYCADEVELNHAKSHFEQTLGCSFNFSSILHDQTSRNQSSAISVEIVKGSLIDQKVDVLVNSTSPDLKLSQGYVSNAILKTAGLQIQEECRRKYAQGIGFGCVAVTSAGNFKHVKQIFHVVLPYWIPTADFSLMILELLVSTCLKYMDELSLDSIAFPALGIGKLEYPIHLVGKTMFDTIHEYSRRNSHTRVKKVMMVVMEDNVAEVFENLQKYPSLGFMQTKVFEEFSVERTCTTVKVKIEKLEDEEKEKMSFYPKGNSNLIHYLCKHDLANLVVEQNWKVILENRDQTLVIKLQVKKEVPIENCRDKVRKLIVKALPTLHQEKCYLSSLSNRDCSNSYQGNKDPLQQALACLVPLVKASENQADLLYDKDLNCVIITGPTETVKQLHMKAKVKLYSVTMETGLESPSHGCLLRTFAVMDQLRGQYPGLTAVVQDCNMRVRWTGTEENIGQGRQEMEKFIREIKTETFLVSSVMKKLLLTPEIKHYIDSVLEKESITCVWQVMETGQVQIWSIQASSSKRAGHKIRENCQEETFSVKDFPFILDVSKIGFGLATTEMKHFSVEETSDTVHVAAKSNTMQKIIQYLQDLEDKQTPRKQPIVHQEGDNSRPEKTTGGCTIEVRGMDKTTSNDMVELYFESKRAGGRPVDIENFDASNREKNGVIFITYKNKEGNLCVTSGRVIFILYASPVCLCCGAVSVVCPASTYPFN